MIQTSSFTEVPDGPHAQIWRYMDFTKFVALLHTKNLWFTRADKFEDVWEMSYPEPYLKQMREATSAQLGRPINKMGTIARLWRQLAFINCWHLNGGESAAMWKLYLSNGEGIAITSTVDRLSQVIPPIMHPEPEQFQPKIPISPARGGGMFQPGIMVKPIIGVVRYEDFATYNLPGGNPNQLPFLKRKSFEHERELRAVYIISPPVDLSEVSKEFPNDSWIYGRNIPVDLSALIEKVYVAPTAGRWLAELVRSLVARYGLSCEVVHSDMYTKPEFY